MPPHIISAPKARYPLAAAVFVCRKQSQASLPPCTIERAQSNILSPPQRLLLKIGVSSYRGSNQKGRKLLRQALLTACKGIVEVFPYQSAYFWTHSSHS